tara:strand:- start:380 stop:775 length:396 start_codon:yes stop_codon:yes gene_type:complete
MFQRKNKGRYFRALTDMTASYNPLLDLCVINKEVNITIIDDNYNEYMSTIFLENDANNDLQVNMWVQVFDNCSYIKFNANDCMWCRDNEIDVLFFIHPIYTSDIAMCFKFHSTIDADNFMKQVNKSYRIGI